MDIDLTGVEIRRFQLSEPKDSLGRARIYGHVHFEGDWSVVVNADSVHQMPSKVHPGGKSVAEAIAKARQLAAALAVVEGSTGRDGEETKR